MSSKNAPRQSLISPLTKLEWRIINPASPQETERAIEAAREAFFPWKITPAPLRGTILRKVGDLILLHKDLLAKVMAMEMGKPLKDGWREVEYTAGFFHWFAGEAERVYGLTIPSSSIDKRLMIIHEPIGVCGVITPWNFPLAMPARKIAAALAAGCTVVAKPSAECPLSMLALAYLCRSAALPAGAFNVVIGPEKEIGKTILESPIIRKLSFTGSTEVGKYLYEHSAPTLKKLTLELGGNAPFIVFNDADLNKAVNHTIMAKFRNSGQTCISPNRIFVQNGIYQAYKSLLVDKVQKLKVGSPLDPESDVSTILHPSVLEKVSRHLSDAFQKGAYLECSGEDIYHPKVLANVTHEMAIYNEETFGPIAPLFHFNTIEEVVTLANESRFGLAAYVFTESLSCAHFIMGALEYGIIGLNDALLSTPQASFGGIKDSGFGREGGPSGIQEYLVEKYFSIGI